MILLLSVLPDDCMDYGLEDVLLRHDALHVLNKVVGLISLLVLQVVDDQVESSLRDHVYQRRQDLEGVLTSSEDN